MARNLHAVEKGLRITGENLVSGVDILFGSGAPGGDADEQDAAPVGSIYMDTGGALYIKVVDNDAAADWEQAGNVVLDDLRWRNEIFRAATTDALSAGTTDPTTWSDNDKGLDDTAFSVGDLILSDSDGTPALFQVDSIASPNLTISAVDQALADGDKFVVRHYLPDSGADQEDAAFLLYGSGSIIKVSDVNWEIANAIFLSGTFAAVNGTPTAGDSVETAISKLSGNQVDIQSASGLTQGDTDYGTFTGDSLADSQTSRQLFQRIETLLEQMRGAQATGITTEATVDSVPVASVKACKWLVEAFEEATPANRQAFEVYALNDGSTDVDDTVYSKLKVGANFDVSLAIDIDTGNMRLRAASTTAGITVTARRIEVVKTVLS